MPKLDLVNAVQIKYGNNQVLQMKGMGFVWPMPKRLPADYIWYDANVDVFSDDAGTIPAVINGPVHCWKSQGSNAWDLVRDPAHPVPTLRVDNNGKRYVSFMETNVFLRCVASFTAYSSIVKAMKIRHAAGTGGQIWGRHNGIGGNRRFGYVQNASGSISFEVQQGSSGSFTPAVSVNDGFIRNLIINTPSGGQDVTVDCFCEVDGQRVNFNLTRGANIATSAFTMGRTTATGGSFDVYRAAFKPAISYIEGENIVVNNWLNDI